MSKLSAAAVAARQEVSIQNSLSGWIAHYSLDDILGADVHMEILRGRIRQAAERSQPVLIHGEGGSGKELTANAVHALSNRSRQPFVWVNCASIPESLIDAELFGYEGGAFTGALTRGKIGKFELANGGTLFLDEIGDMPVHLQGSLLSRGPKPGNCSRRWHSAHFDRCTDHLRDEPPAQRIRSQRGVSS